MKGPVRFLESPVRFLEGPGPSKKRTESNFFHDFQGGGGPNRKNLESFGNRFFPEKITTPSGNVLNVQPIFDKKYLLTFP